jgi:hypothetical protein
MRGDKVKKFRWSLGIQDPKGKCDKCKKRMTLDLKGRYWVVPSHVARVLGRINDECKGTGTKIMENVRT